MHRNIMLRGIHEVVGYVRRMSFLGVQANRTPPSARLATPGCFGTPLASGVIAFRNFLR
jgi:hypothetical protein